MRNLLVLFLLALSVSAYASDFPGQIYLKSATQSFTHEYDVAIIDGKIWSRPRISAEGKPAQWKLLGKTGLPASSRLLGIGGFKSPSSVVQLSADGDNLIAVGNDGFIYYMKWGTQKWVNTWGKPFSQKLRLPPNIRAWSISHRGPFAGGYHDIDGHFHTISVGVTTLYALSEDGLTIQYADPWLPADFSSEICGPLKNRFRARSLAASASTLFVVSDAGEMYTRLADFDTLGLNPFLDYSFNRKIAGFSAGKEIRALPAEAWKKQPSIPSSLGRITSAITILQTGKGNDARELRVEGVNAAGAHGFFSKPVNGDVWQFTQTNLPLQKPLLSAGNGISDLGPNPELTVAGTLRLGWISDDRDYPIELKNFNPPCPDATLVVFLESGKVVIPVSLVASSRTDRKMKGALFMPAAYETADKTSAPIQEWMQKVFNKQSFVDIRLTINQAGNAIIKTHYD